MLRIVKLLDVVLMTIPLAAVWYLYYASRIHQPFYGQGNWAVIFLFCVLFYVFGRIYDAFLVSVYRISEMIYSQVLAVAMSDAMMFIVLWILTRRFPNILPALCALAVQYVFAAVWSVFAHNWYFKTFERKKCAIIFNTEEGTENLINEY